MYTMYVYTIVYTYIVCVYVYVCAIYIKEYIAQRVFIDKGSQGLGNI